MITATVEAAQERATITSLTATVNCQHSSFRFLLEVSVGVMKTELKVT